MIALSIVVAASAASAQVIDSDSPNAKKGFAVEQTYQAHDIDHINLFNGNLIVQIPIGQRYPVSGQLSYALTLTYNSRVWDHVATIPTGTNQAQLDIRPSQQSNAGVGWLLSLGRILYTNNAASKFGGSIVYESPDGQQHRIFCRMHDTEQPPAPDVCNGVVDDPLANPAGNGVQGFTHDGTYLRMRILSASPTLRAVIEFPDGITHTFEEDKTVTDPNFGQMRITEMRDRFNNAVTIDYSTPLQWTITECSANCTVRRTHKVHFQGVANQTQTNYKTRVSSVDVASWSGTGGTATYTFNYFADGQEILPLPPSSCYTQLFAAPTGTIRPPVLQSISLPTGEKYAFTYYDAFASFLSSTQCAGGALKQLTLPSRGTIDYTYMLYKLPHGGCTADSVYDRVAGISSRTVTDTVRNQAYHWTYQTQLAGTSQGWTCSGSADPAYTDLENTVFQKETNVTTKHYFSVWPHDFPPTPNSPYTKTEYGLPFTKSNPLSCPSGAATGCQRYLSTSMSDGSHVTLSYVTYETDPKSPDDVSTNTPVPVWDLNVRLSGTKTAYDDGTFADTMNSSFDGLGHYRTTTTTGTFPGNNNRTETIDYNKGFSIPVTTTYVDPEWPYGKAWILDTYDFTKSVEGNSTMQANTCFDATTGFLTARRLLASGTTESGSGCSSATNTPCDVLTIFSQSSGNVTGEAFYGGDKNPGSGCTASVAAAYDVLHTYAGGALETSTYSGSGFYFVNNKKANGSTGIDSNTGLTTTTQDSGGIVTDFTYDKLGRVLTATPASGEGAAFNYTYTTDSSPFIHVEAKSGSSTIDEKYTRFDSLGRPWLEFVRMPADDPTKFFWGVTAIDYDANGRQTAVYERGSFTGTPSQATEAGLTTGQPPVLSDRTTTRYDYFGRPLSVTQPDGGGASYSYRGVTQATETVVRANQDGTPRSDNTVRVFDRQGRLAKVTENSNNTSAGQTTGAAVTTTYGYDAAGRLTDVSIGGPTPQPRSFTYDGRGFLIKESHPESGDTTYPKYDARGHALQRINGGNTLNFAYDSAERLQSVTDGSGHVLKEFGYATSGRANGRLLTATRRNFLQSAGEVDVTETYSYGGPSAQIDKRDTKVESVNGGSRNTIQTFHYGVNYDDLLLPIGISMPTCDTCAATLQNALPTVTNDRTDGYLTGVEGFATQLTYHPSGMVKDIVFKAPGLAKDTYSQENGMPRPSKITFSSCSDLTPYFLPGGISIHAGQGSCGLTVSWPAAAVCAGATGITYTVLRDGQPIPNGTCLPALNGTSPNVTVFDPGAVPDANHAYVYSIIAEGPTVTGGLGACHQGNEIKVVSAPFKYISCAAGIQLTVSPLFNVPIGAPFTYQATLATPNGPLVGETISFNVNGKLLTALTGPDGVGRVTTVLDVPAVKIPGGLVVSFAGDGDLPAAQPQTSDLVPTCTASSYGLVPSRVALTAAPQNVNVLVGTSRNCSWMPFASNWNPDSTDPQITVSDPTVTRQGSATFMMGVPVSPVPSRTTQVNASPVSALFVTQSSTCSYQFVQDPSYFPAQTFGATASLNIATTDGCPWSATPHYEAGDPGNWIRNVQTYTQANAFAKLVACGSGTPVACSGPGVVQFTVDDNFGSSRRTATVVLTGGSSTASAHLNQEALPPFTCPTLIQDISGGSTSWPQQNISMRAYATGTDIVYDWFVNDVPCPSCGNSGALVRIPGDPNYPPTGQSFTYQANIHPDYNKHPNAGCSIATKKVTWSNNIQSTQCRAPLLGDSFCFVYGPNRWPGDDLASSPGAPVQLIVETCDDPATMNLTFQWYYGVAGDRSSPIPNGTNFDSSGASTVTFPSTSTFAWVEATNTCADGSKATQQSRTAVIVVTAPPPGPKHRACCRAAFVGGSTDNLLWHNAATGANEVWTMSGGTHVNTYPLQANGNLNEKPEAIGDLNGDGAPDVIWRDTSGNDNTWLIQNLAVRSVTPLEGRSDTHWTIGAVADLTGEGHDSIAWHNEATGENEIWFQDTTNHVGSWALPATPDANWGLHGAGDFNGDGTLDLFFHNRQTGENQIWMMSDGQRQSVTSNSVGARPTTLHRPTRIATQSIESMPDTNWVPASVADLNGDGYPDIVWRNVTTGENKVWLMSGTTHYDTQPVETRSDQNWQIGGGGSTNAPPVAGVGGTGTTPTTLTLTADPAALGTASAVTATLTSNGSPVSQRLLVFTINSTEVVRLLTDDSGVAVAAVPVGSLAAGTYPNALGVRFDGDTTYAASTATANLVVNGPQPVITWTPAPLVYGMPLGAPQLNATASVSGSFVYTPPAGTILNAGYQQLTATFTPTDTTITPIATNATVSVAQVPATVSWTTPDSIGYGTALTPTQLDATANVSGTFAYSPAAGSVLNVGNAQTLGVTFTPDDPNYAAATATTTIDVVKGTETILWDDPAPITPFQPLSNVQLNARVLGGGSTPIGAVTYDPPAGTLLSVGIHQLTVNVAATDNYEAASATVDVVVYRVNANVQWATPAPIAYGTALSGTQLNATSDVAGTFTYDPPAGTILDGGAQQLDVVFTPADDRYQPVEANVTLQVNRGQQTLTWSKPAPIVYGTPLSDAQLDAQVQVIGPAPAGILEYNPPSGTVLNAGPAQTLTVTADENVDYDSATLSTTIDVLKATPVVTWPQPATIVYGTALSATQLDASANVPGTFTYNPPPGTILNAGSQTLQVVFTPADGVDYNAVSATVAINVAKADQTITWATPADIVYGTSLSSTQLNATVAVVGPASAGALTYTPASGTVLQADPAQTLTVVAAETPNYNSATKTVLINVLKAHPVLTWPAPAAIVYGTALSATQLDATADVSGTFVYTPPAGTILDAGNGETLSVAFTPADTHNYETASATTTIDVAKAKQTIAWTAPAAIVYGIALSPAQLNATVSVVGPAPAGALVYAPAAGTVLDAGSGQTLTVNALETNDYLPATASVTITVNKAPLTLRVDNQTKVYGAPLPTLTGTLTGVVNHDAITPQYSTTATVSSVVGTYPITGQLLDPNNRLRNYDVTIIPATFTVTKAPLVVTANDATKQYSDPMPPFTVSFRGFVLGETPAVLGGTLQFQTTATTSSGPGTYPIAVSGLTSPNYDIAFVTGTLTVTPEDAAVSFLAPATVAANPVTGSATVTLASLVTNPRDAEDAAGPDGLGDIRHATLTYLDRNTGRTLCVAPLGLVSPSDTTVAIATCTFTAPIGTYIVESRVGGWYVRDAAADDVTLNVIKPNDDFVTGGGWATLGTSGGSYAADAQSRADFTLNPQYDDKSGAVKGSVTLTFLRTQDGTLHKYQLTSPSLASLAIARTTAGGIAAITGPATLTDITSAQNPVVIDANATLFATFADNGQPSTNDTIAVTLLARNGGLLVSTNWNGAATADLAIASGNIEVHKVK